MIWIIFWIVVFQLVVWWLLWIRFKVWEYRDEKKKYKKEKSDK